MKQLSGLCLLSCYLILANPVQAAKIDPQPEIQKFIAEMVSQHGFDNTYLQQLFSKVELRDSIIKAITRPAEAKPWHEYRKIFLTSSRINGGVEFWNKHQATVDAVSLKYGVPAEILIAILGVETRYGGNTGSYPVLDALSTLAFMYPKRSPFFRSELEHFLLLAREEGVDPMSLKGSYAGAMGLPQFMPSSYRHYAVDYNEDGRRNIWEDPADTLGSIANYFVKHGWQSGKSIIFKTKINDSQAQPLLSEGLKPDLQLAQLSALGIKPPAPLDSNVALKLLKYDQPKHNDYWLGLKNFYVITRYNHSHLYAMAIYQLSQEILALKHAPKRN